jgi:hypothetical protein
MVAPIAAVVPQTYEQWAHCIVHACGMPLTPEFARARLESLTRAHGEEAERFAALHGRDQRARVTAWYGRTLARSGEAIAGGGA